MSWEKDGDVGEDVEKEGGAAFTRCFLDTSFNRASPLSRETVRLSGVLYH